MNRKYSELQRQLRDTPFFWSRLGFCYDPPRAGADGKQIIFSREFDEYRRVCRDFADAGVRWQTTILHSGWVADGKYDYTLCDETLDALLDGNPDIMYMPRVKLNVPPDWCKNHPEDTFVYYFGPREADEIAALATTDRHDYFGADTDGYSVNGGKGAWPDDRVNRGGLIGLQSFSSRKWVEDASETLRRLLSHLSESKYRKQIIGVHIAYGMCGETNVWGVWSPLGDGHRGDFGINARRNFAEYGIAKYGSREAALAAWGGSLEPPTPLEREAPRERLCELFLSGNQKVRDYFEFTSATNADATEAYCKIVKDASGLFGRELAAGVFYGYMYLPQSPNAGHLAIERLLDSPYVDFMSSPKGYFRCLAGDPGGEQGPSESIALSKVWLDEIDNHTHLDRRPEGRARDMAESKTLLWREATKNLTHGQGFWWMDLGEGWYDDPELMHEIRKLTELGERLKSKPRESVAEILLVVDEKSLGSMSISYGLNYGLMYQLHSELKLCGAPVDTLRFTDLFTQPLDNYKLIVFANCFCVTPDERERLLRLTADKLVVWHYAAGILSPEFDIDNCRKLTGFRLRELERGGSDFIGYTREYYNNSHRREPNDFPLITFDADGAEVLACYPTGEPLAAIRGRVCVAAAPCLNAADFRSLARRAGVDILCDADCTVYADNRIVGFFPKEDFHGQVRLCGREIAADIPAHGMKVFEL